MSDGPMLLPASVIICSRNRPRLLVDAVTSVTRSSRAPAEVIVVDQSDADNAELERLDSSPTRLRYVRSAVAGVSRARNHGAALADHELLAFADDDVLVDADWLARLVQAQRARGPGSVITGRVLAAEAPGETGFAPSTKADVQGTVFRRRTCEGVLYSGCMAIDRATLQSIGGFDERLGPGTHYPAAEDNDLCWRLLEAGFQIVYEPAAVVFHRAWRSQRALMGLRWNYGRGQGAFYAKHIRVRDSFMARCMLRNVHRRVLRLVDVARTRRRLDTPELAYTAGLLSGAIEWWLLGQRLRSHKT